MKLNLKQLEDLATYVDNLNRAVGISASAMADFTRAVNEYKLKFKLNPQSSKTKIIILLPCWGRAKLLKKVSEQLEVFCKANEADYLIKVLFVFSQEDAELEQLAVIYNKAQYDRDYCYCSNEKLGRKHNAGIRKAAELGYDYLMNLGSDDLIHEDLMKLYASCIRDKKDVFGVNRLYFYDTKSKRAIHFRYYNNPHIVGAGRMISRRAIEAVKGKFASLYLNDSERGLDGKSASRLMACGFKQEIIDAGDFPYVVDIKCGENINDFKRILESSNKNGIIEVGKEVIFREFGVRL